MADILIKNANILTMDDKRRCFDDGALVVEGNSIVAVGKTSEIEKKHKAERVIDAKNMVLMPGLINGHNHYEQSFLKGLTRLFTGDTFKWIREFKIPFMKEMEAEDYYLSSLLACTEMIKTGTTCSINFVCQQNPKKVRQFGADNAARAINESGMRSLVAVGVADKNEPSEFLVSVKEGVGLIDEIYRRWHGKANGRLRVWGGFVSPMVATTELWAAVKNLVGKHGTGIHTHINGTGDFEGLYEAGLLGPYLTCAHIAWLNRREISLFSETQTNGVVCPTYNYSPDRPEEKLVFGDGLAPVSDLMDLGVTVGIGTDACMGDTQDMFREMRNMARCQQYVKRDKLVMPPTKLLEMATIDCAKTMHWENEIGSLEPGKKADVILVNIKKPHMTPWTNSPACLVYLASGCDVDTVIIDGKIVMEKRELKMVEEDEVINKAQEVAEKLIERTGFKSMLETGFKPWCSGHRLHI